MTVVTGHSVALSRRSYLFSTMSSLHNVLVHDIGYSILNFSLIKSVWWILVGRMHSCLDQKRQKSQTAESISPIFHP
jgi:hypothetical protein